MSVQTVPRPRPGVKPATARKPILYLRLPPIPFNRFDSWPSISAVYESWWGSVLGIDLDHPNAVTALAALRTIAPEARRVEPFADAVRR